jgi:hypothetical protein
VTTMTIIALQMTTLENSSSFRHSQTSSSVAMRRTTYFGRPTIPHTDPTTSLLLLLEIKRARGHDPKNPKQFQSLTTMLYRTTLINQLNVKGCHLLSLLPSRSHSTLFSAIGTIFGMSDSRTPHDPHLPRILALNQHSTHQIAEPAFVQNNIKALIARHSPLPRRYATSFTLISVARSHCRKAALNFSLPSSMMFDITSSSIQSLSNPLQQSRKPLKTSLKWQKPRQANVLND